MPEFIDIDTKRVAITLGDELSYPRAAEKLNMSPDQLRMQIVALERKLSIQLFKDELKSLVLTEEGRALINSFRKAVALHDKEHP